MFAHPHGARANGRFPRAERLLEDPRDSSHLLLAATYGLLVTEDRGQSWFHVCETAFAEPGQQTDPVVALTVDGGLLTSTFNALQRSSTGVCDFARHLGGNPSQAVPDFTVDATGAVIAVLVTTANGRTTNQLQESLDGGQTFHALGPPLPERLRLVATVDIAPSDPQRIYLSGWGANSAGVLLRSDDRGESYTARPLATDAESDEVPFIAAVDPKNANALYVRTDVWRFDPDFGLPTAADALLFSNDGGDSFSELIRHGLPARPILRAWSRRCWLGLAWCGVVVGRRCCCPRSRSAVAAPKMTTERRQAATKARSARAISIRSSRA